MEEIKSQDCESVLKESSYEETVKKVNSSHFRYSFLKDRKEVCFYCDKEEDQENLFVVDACYCLTKMNIHIDCFYDYKKKYGEVCYRCKTIYKETPNQEERNKIEDLFLEKVIENQKLEEKFNKMKDSFWDMVEKEHPEYSFLRKYYENLEEKHRRLSRNCAMIMKTYEKNERSLEEDYKEYLSKWK